MTVRPAQALAVLQAENATLSGPVVRRDHAGYTGTGFADFVNDSGAYVEWTFDTPSLRSYTLTFRYANGGAAARPLQLTINGLDEGRLSFGPTGSWSTWRTESFTIVLDGPARFRVRLTAVGSSGPNIDSLTVS
jgi:hypothetical protein